MWFFPRKKGIPNNNDKNWLAYNSTLLNTAMQLIRQQHPKKFPKNFKFEGSIGENIIEIKGNFKISEPEQYTVSFEYDGELRDYQVTIKK